MFNENAVHESPLQNMNQPDKESSKRKDAYWRQSLTVVYVILAIWAFISLGCGIVFRDWLDASMPTVGHAPFGFWMAQQGAIIGFLILLVVYMLAMNRLDQKHGFDKENDQ